MYIPHLGLGAKDIMISRSRNIFVPYGTYILGREADINQIIKEIGNYNCNNYEKTDTCWYFGES